MKRYLIICLQCSIFINTTLAQEKEADLTIPINHFVPQIIRSATASDNSSNILLSIFGWNSKNRRSEVNTFSSFDAGKTYKLVLSDTSSQWVSEVSNAYGNDGHAYVITGASKRTGKLRGHTYGEMHLYSTENGGRSWNKPFKNFFIDWTAAVVDQSEGIYKNRLYILGYDIADGNGNWVGPRKPLLYSDNYGKTISPPKFTGKWPHDGGGYPLSAVIGSRGYLYILYKRDNPGGLVMTVSQNGGEDLEIKPNLPKDSLISKRNIFDVGFDIDKSIKNKDKLLITYAATYNGKSGIMLAESDDMGATWKQKVAIPYEASPLPQELGASLIKVSKDGTIGVLWTEPSQKLIKFSISKNSGKSFEPGNIVAKYSPNNFKNGQFLENLLQTMGTFEPDDNSQEVRSSTGLSVRILPFIPAISLTSDINNNFHVFYTTQNENGYTKLLSKTVKSIPMKNTLSIMDTKTLKNINQKIIIDIYNQEYMDDKGEFVIDFTLTNKSDSIIVNPIFAEITKMVPGFGFRNVKLLTDYKLITERNNPVIMLSNHPIRNLIVPGKQTQKFQLKFKVDRSLPFIEIWDKIQSGQTVHPLSVEIQLLTN